MQYLLLIEHGFSRFSRFFMIDPENHEKSVFRPTRDLRLIACS